MMKINFRKNYSEKSIGEHTHTKKKKRKEHKNNYGQYVTEKINYIEVE